ncbi:transglutaminase domain-containing protein [Thermosulfurimonas marina]|uniref:Transglutaminase domain-containing protein n=1 Tax=Thermosulfurimonas marina TaxID=2047767 RepID=A0A6H1WTD1_9BACT|nr:transglutaminase domain-containing protein [Thermosulfurimonas marina]QJA06409.1 transglutaminase domain-containing protein [Thermosulfurimonas marina]
MRKGNSLVLVVLLLFCWIVSVRAAEQVSGWVTWRVGLKPSEGTQRIRLWLPYPPTNAWQRISSPRVYGNYDYQGTFTDEKGNLVLYFEWHKLEGPAPEVVVSYRVECRERVARDFEREKDLPVDRAAFKEALSSNAYIDLRDPRLKAILAQILPGKRTAVEKARAIYDWVVRNMRRDPRVKGCGPGLICNTLSRRCGKCADLNSVFVALCRAAGVPAREIFGLRLSREVRDTLSGGQHCWAEFYVPGYGWVPADPADVLKAALVKGVSPTGPELASLREYFFGAVEPYRIELSRGRGLRLNPPQAGPPVNYFAYPYVEFDDQPVDPFGPEVDLEILWERAK